MFRTQNLCPGSKNVFDSRQKYLLFPSSKICLKTENYDVDVGDRDDGDDDDDYGGGNYDM